MNTIVISPTKSINSELLYQELIRHGHELLGTWSDADQRVNWTVTIGDDVDPDDVQAIVNAHDPNQFSDGQRSNDQLDKLTQSMAGVDLTRLSQAQQKTLLVLILQKLGGIDLRTMTIKPLAEWG